MADDSKDEKSVGISPDRRQDSIDQDIGDLKDVVGEKKDVDAALQFLRSEGDVRPMTAADEKKLKRKIDWMIMPLMFGCYCLQYLDKTLINYANVMGLQADADITPYQYSQLAMIFYVSYLGFEMPHAYGMQRFPTGRYIGIMVVFWGVIVTVTCAATNWAGLVTTRVLLGVFESAIAPSLILITSMWYKRSEQPPRVGLWYQGVGLGTIVGALISFGFQHYEGDSFRSWQIMFLVVGLITVSTGVATFLFLPNNPMTSKRLTHEEKVWAIERLRENQTGVENKHFKPKQVVECFLDPQTWFLLLITISSSVPNGAVSSFQATIISDFGYTSKESALLQIPGGATNCVAVFAATLIAGRYNRRGLNIVVMLAIGCLGGCLMAFLPEDNRAGLLIGNYLTNCISASLPLLYSWVAANYAGHTKKVTMNALLLIAFCIGNIIGPLTFTGESAPEYIPAKVTIVVTCAVAAGLCTGLMCYYTFENKRREKLLESGGVGHTRDVEFADLTDRLNKEFRYQM